MDIGLVLAWHNDAAKEWGALGAWYLVPIDINYKPKINRRPEQGERTGAGAQQESGTADGSTEIVGESQEGSGRIVNRSARLVERPGQVAVPVESREDVSTHIFWKRGTTTMFDI